MGAMKIKKFTAMSTLVITALGIATGTASATPSGATATPGSAQSSTAQTPINYKVSRVATSALLTTDAGSLTATDNQLQILDRSGVVAATVPLTYVFQNHSFPIAAHVNGNTATLTPSTNLAQSAPVKDEALPFLHQADLNAAMGATATNMTAATEIGAVVGAIIGGVGGCVGGALLGLGATAPLLGLLGAGPIAGCAIGALTLGPVGGLAGAVLIGGPALVATAFQFVQLLGEPAK